MPAFYRDNLMILAVNGENGYGKMGRSNNATYINRRPAVKPRTTELTY